MKIQHFPLFILGALCLLVHSSCSTKKQDRPNILFILADDLSYRDLSAFGQQQYVTPNLDQLATRGIRFTQAYAAAPECAPSRGCLMTGLHTGHGPIRVNASARGQDHLQDEDLTIAEVLQEAGYRTGFCGKWGIGMPETEGVPYNQGFDFAFGFYDQERAHTFIPNFLWKNDSMIKYPQNRGFDMKKRYDQSKPDNTYDTAGKLYINELPDAYDYRYSDDQIRQAALEFLNNNLPNKTGQPFFLYYAPQLPHGPMIVPELGEMRSPEEINLKAREWAAMVIRLDQAVGELTDFLKDQQLMENTIIFFSSDNGYSMCGYMNRGNAPDWPDDPWLQNKGPFTGGKFSVLEGGCRIPMFMYWKGKTSRQIVETPIWLPDFFPTAVELSGGNPSDYKTDGLSLVPLLEGGEESFPGHEYLYFSKQREQAVRLGPWKAYRTNPDSKTELYLIEEDTYALKDMADLYPDIVARAEEIMQTEHTPHPWYWNPWETREEYQEKIKKARDTRQIMTRHRPNAIDSVDWTQFKAYPKK